tara:strand:+ start:10517 stop:10867 length:351 start_codon:yes stop_codon:yes gene_type:complete
MTTPAHIDKIAREYAVTVLGFPTVNVIASSSSQARARAWREYQSYDDRCSFKKFMSICRNISLTKRDFQQIAVNGKPARLLPGESLDQNTVKFVYAGTDVVMQAHQLECCAISVER